MKTTSATIGLVDIGNQELSLPSTIDTAREGSGTTFVEPCDLAPDHHEDVRCTTISDEANSARQHDPFVVSRGCTVSEKIHQGTPLAQDRLCLSDVEPMKQSSDARKRTYASSVDKTTVVSPHCVSDITTDLALDDDRLAKRLRSAEQSAESVMLDSFPTPEFTPPPTHSGLDSCSTVGDDPHSGPLDTSPQSGDAGCPAPSFNEIVQKFSDDDARTRGLDKELLISMRHTVNSLPVVEGEDYGENNGELQESCGNEQVNEVSSRASASTAPRCQRSSQPGRENRRGPIRCACRGRDENTVTTRISQDATSYQCLPPPKPRMNSTDCSSILPSVVEASDGTSGNDKIIDDMLYRTMDIMYSDVPEGSSVVTAIVHCNESSAAPDAADVYNSLFGSGGKGIRMMRLWSDSWVLFGYRYAAALGSSVHGSLASLNTDRTSDLDSVTDQLDSDSDEGDGDDEGHRSLAASCKQIDTREYISRPQQLRKPWARSDEERLLSYKDKMGMEWKDIFKRFPDRTSGAIRTRWHMVRGRRHTTATT